MEKADIAFIKALRRTVDMAEENKTEENKIRVLIEENDVGFTLSIKADRLEKTYQHMELRVALNHASWIQALLGLPDERILVKCKAVLKDAARSVDSLRVKEVLTREKKRALTP